MKRVSFRDGLILLGILLMMLLPFVATGWYVAHKHQWAHSRLEEVEPRYARLLGLDAQRPDIAAVRAQADAARAQYTYPASQDANQSGNAAQQRIRDIFSSAGLQVISSQVMPPKEEKGFDRIPITVRTEGEMLAVHSALAVLSSQMPVIIINELEILLPGGLSNANPRFTPRLSASFSLSVLKERSR